MKLEGTNSPDKSAGNGMTKNIEKFRATFQKSSQIYTFLRERWKTSPLYLVRTLSFITKHRPTRIKSCRKTRSSESIDHICNRLKQAGGLHNNTNGSKQSLKITNHHESNNKIKLEPHNGTNGHDKYKTHAEVVSSKSAKTKEKNNVDSTTIFNWVCNDPERTSQKTKTDDFICAWCDRSFRYFDALMIHLRSSHQRINFNLVKEASGQTVIEVTINESFDGSYCGFKFPGHNLRHDFRFTPRNPERRTPSTQVIFFKHKDRKSVADIPIHKPKCAPDGDTPMDDDEADIDVCSGRLYYHTSTCLPVKPNEVDIDSEADMDPDWLRERTQLMIDEFTDVNEGEKEILKLWNLHIMKNYKYKGDNHIRQACLDFVESEGHTILSKKLSKNFTLHLANLYDFGLISSKDLIECVRELKKLRPVTITASPTKTSGKRTSNEHCQHSPPAKRALLNSNCNK